MLVYRAYLIENGHVSTALDLFCADDDDAKRQMEDLSEDQDIELWQNDRKVAILVRRGAH